ncbi:MAG: hypothetical protein HQL52_11265 [Magnetococcales bacterium]|nr:hypothetical protein [Magnetococcales bacterium]
MSQGNEPPSNDPPASQTSTPQGGETLQGLAAFRAAATRVADRRKGLDASWNARKRFSPPSGEGEAQSREIELAEPTEETRSPMTEKPTQTPDSQALTPSVEKAAGPFRASSQISGDTPTPVVTETGIELMEAQASSASSLPAATDTEPATTRNRPRGLQPSLFRFNQAYDDLSQVRRSVLEIGPGSPETGLLRSGQELPGGRRKSRIGIQTGTRAYKAGSPIPYVPGEIPGLQQETLPETARPPEPPPEPSTEPDSEVAPVNSQTVFRKAPPPQRVMTGDPVEQAATDSSFVEPLQAAIPLPKSVPSRERVGQEAQSREESQGSVGGETLEVAEAGDGNLADILNDLFDAPGKESEVPTPLAPAPSAPETPALQQQAANEETADETPLTVTAAETAIQVLEEVAGDEELTGDGLSFAELAAQSLIKPVRNLDPLPPVEGQDAATQGEAILSSAAPESDLGALAREGIKDPVEAEAAEQAPQLIAMAEEVKSTESTESTERAAVEATLANQDTVILSASEVQTVDAGEQAPEEPPASQEVPFVTPVTPAQGEKQRIWQNLADPDGQGEAAVSQDPFSPWKPESGQVEAPTIQSTAKAPQVAARTETPQMAARTETPQVAAPQAEVKASPASTPTPMPTPFSPEDPTLFRQSKERVQMGEVLEPERGLAPRAIPVEGLATGVVHLLGDMVGGVIGAGRFFSATLSAPFRKKSSQSTPRGTTSKSLSIPGADLVGRVSYGVMAMVRGVGQILKGGGQVIMGTLNCLGGAMTCIATEVLGFGNGQKKSDERAQLGHC